METINQQIEKAYADLWSTPKREALIVDDQGKVSSIWETYENGEWVDYNKEYEKRVRPLLNIRAVFYPPVKWF